MFHFTILYNGSFVKSDLYGRGKEGSEVLFYAVYGAGHSIPSIDHRMKNLLELLLGKQNHDIESARHAWDFLSRK